MGPSPDRAECPQRCCTLHYKRREHEEGLTIGTGKHQTAELFQVDGHVMIDALHPTLVLFYIVHVRQLMFAVAILTISISPRVPEWHKPDSE